MHAGLCTQPAEGMIAAELHGGPFHPGHLAGGELDDLGGESTLFTPAQIHAQQHLRPVLGFCATGASLYFQKRIGRVHLTFEHAAEFERCQILLQLTEILLDFGQGGIVCFFGREFCKFREIAELRGQPLEQPEYLFQFDPLFVQRPGVVRVVPDIGIGKGELYLFESQLLVFEVKDAP